MVELKSEGWKKRRKIGQVTVGQMLDIAKYVLNEMLERKLVPVVCLMYRHSEHYVEVTQFHRSNHGVRIFSSKFGTEVFDLYCVD